MKSKKKYFFRAIAIMTVFIFVSTSVTWGQPVAPVTLEQQSTFTGILPSQLNIPETLGSIQTQFSETSLKKPLIVVIQDAHSVLDAQIHIQELIHYLENKYGIHLVGLEGGKGKLDPTIFRAFPDEFVKKKVISAYLNRGELTGGEMAAILSATPQGGSASGGNSEKSSYFGIEDWNLYEANYLAYLKAMQVKDEALKTIDGVKTGFDRERKQIYSSNFNEFHEQLEIFQTQNTYLLEFLKYLGGVAGAKDKITNYPYLAKLAMSFEFEKETEKDKGNIESSIRQMADAFKGKYLSRMNIKQEMAFHKNHQAFVTNQMDAAAFLKYLIETGEGFGLKPKLTPTMMRVLGYGETLATIKGTKVFDELQAFISEVENTLATKPEEKALAEKYRQLKLFKDLASLELTRDRWKEVGAQFIAPVNQGVMNHAPTLNLFPPLTLDLFSPALDYYRNAVERDQAFIKNLKDLIEKQKAQAAIVLAGGFHAQGFENNLKQSGMPYVVITPKIQSLAGQETYQDVMQGKLSYKPYLRTTFYDAFVRHSSLQMVAELNEPDFRKNLKLWRDEVIRRLSAEGRITQARDYTRYIDLLFKTYYEKYGKEEYKGKSKEEIIKAVEKELNDYKEDALNRLWGKFQLQVKTFAQGLQSLIQRKELNRESVSGLLDQVSRGGTATSLLGKQALTLVSSSSLKDNRLLMRAATDLKGVLKEELKAIEELPPARGDVMERGLEILADRMQTSAKAGVGQVGGEEIAAIARAVEGFEQGIQTEENAIKASEQIEKYIQKRFPGEDVGGVAQSILNEKRKKIRGPAVGLVLPSPADVARAEVRAGSEEEESLLRRNIINVLELKAVTNRDGGYKWVATYNDPNLDSIRFSDQYTKLTRIAYALGTGEAFENEFRALFEEKFELVKLFDNLKRQIQALALRAAGLDTKNGILPMGEFKAAMIKIEKEANLFKAKLSEEDEEDPAKKRNFNPVGGLGPDAMNWLKQWSPLDYPELRSRMTKKESSAQSEAQKILKRYNVDAIVRRPAQPQRSALPKVQPVKESKVEAQREVGAATAKAAEQVVSRVDASKAQEPSIDNIIGNIRNLVGQARQAEGKSPEEYEQKLKEAERELEKILRSIHRKIGRATDRDLRLAAAFLDQVSNEVNPLIRNRDRSRRNISALTRMLQNKRNQNPESPQTGTARAEVRSMSEEEKQFREQETFNPDAEAEVNRAREEIANAPTAAPAAVNLSPSQIAEAPTNVGPAEAKPASNAGVQIAMPDTSRAPPAAPSVPSVFISSRDSTTVEAKSNLDGITIENIEVFSDHVSIKYQGNPEHVELTKKIETGGMGTIYIGVNPINGKTFTFKMSKGNPTSNALVENEARAYDRIKQANQTRGNPPFPIPNVIEQGALTNGIKYFVAFDPPSPGDFSKTKFDFSEEHHTYVFSDYVLFSAWLFALGFAETDLKPSNVLVTESGARPIDLLAHILPTDQDFKYETKKVKKLEKGLSVFEPRSAKNLWGLLPRKFLGFNTRKVRDLFKESILPYTNGYYPFSLIDQMAAGAANDFLTKRLSFQEAARDFYGKIMLFQLVRFFIADIAGDYSTDFPPDATGLAQYTYTGQNVEMVIQRKFPEQYRDSARDIAKKIKALAEFDRLLPFDDLQQSRIDVYNRMAELIIQARKLANLQRESADQLAPGNVFAQGEMTDTERQRFESFHRDIGFPEQLPLTEGGLSEVQKDALSRGKIREFFQTLERTIPEKTAAGAAAVGETTLGQKTAILRSEVRSQLDSTLTKELEGKGFDPLTAATIQLGVQTAVEGFATPANAPTYLRSILDRIKPDTRTNRILESVPFLKQAFQFANNNPIATGALVFAVTFGLGAFLGPLSALLGAGIAFLTFYVFAETPKNSFLIPNLQVGSRNAQGDSNFNLILANAIGAAFHGRYAFISAESVANQARELLIEENQRIQSLQFQKKKNSDENYSFADAVREVVVQKIIANFDLKTPIAERYRRLGLTLPGLTKDQIKQAELIFEINPETGKNYTQEEAQQKTENETVNLGNEDEDIDAIFGGGNVARQELKRGLKWAQAQPTVVALEIPAEPQDVSGIVSKAGDELQRRRARDEGEGGAAVGGPRAEVRQQTTEGERDVLGNYMNRTEQLNEKFQALLDKVRSGTATKDEISEIQKMLSEEENVDFKKASNDLTQNGSIGQAVLEKLIDAFLINPSQQLSLSMIFMDLTMANSLPGEQATGTWFKEQIFKLVQDAVKDAAVKSGMVSLFQDLAGSSEGYFNINVGAIGLSQEQLENILKKGYQDIKDRLKSKLRAEHADENIDWKKVEAMINNSRLFGSQVTVSIPENEKQKVEELVKSREAGSRDQAARYVEDVVLNALTKVTAEGELLQDLAKNQPTTERGPPMPLIYNENKILFALQRKLKPETLQRLLSDFEKKFLPLGRFDPEDPSRDGHIPRPTHEVNQVSEKLNGSKTDPNKGLKRLLEKLLASGASGQNAETANSLSKSYNEYRLLMDRLRLISTQDTRGDRVLSLQGAQVIIDGHNDGTLEKLLNRLDQTARELKPTTPELERQLDAAKKTVQDFRRTPGFYVIRFGGDEIAFAALNKEKQLVIRASGDLDKFKRYNNAAGRTKNDKIYFEPLYQMYQAAEEFKGGMNRYLSDAEFGSFFDSLQKKILEADIVDGNGNPVKLGVFKFPYEQKIKTSQAVERLEIWQDETTGEVFASRGGYSDILGWSPLLGADAYSLYGKPLGKLGRTYKIGTYSSSKLYEGTTGFTGVIGSGLKVKDGDNEIDPTNVNDYGNYLAGFAKHQKELQVAKVKTGTDLETKTNQLRFMTVTEAERQYAELERERYRKSQQDRLERLRAEGLESLMVHRGELGAEMRKVLDEQRQRINKAGINIKEDAEVKRLQNQFDRMADEYDVLTNDIEKIILENEDLKELNDRSRALSVELTAVNEELGEITLAILSLPVNQLAEAYKREANLKVRQAAIQANQNDIEAQKLELDIEARTSAFRNYINKLGREISKNPENESVYQEAIEKLKIESQMQDDLKLMEQWIALRRERNKALDAGRRALESGNESLAEENFGKSSDRTNVMMNLVANELENSPDEAYLTILRRLKAFADENLNIADEEMLQPGLRGPTQAFVFDEEESLIGAARAETRSQGDDRAQYRQSQSSRLARLVGQQQTEIPGLDKNPTFEQLPGNTKSEKEAFVTFELKRISPVLATIFGEKGGVRIAEPTGRGKLVDGKQVQPYLVFELIAADGESKIRGMNRGGDEVDSNIEFEHENTRLQASPPAGVGNELLRAFLILLKERGYPTVRFVDLNTYPGSKKFFSSLFKMWQVNTDLPGDEYLLQLNSLQNAETPFVGRLRAFIPVNAIQPLDEERILLQQTLTAAMQQGVESVILTGLVNPRDSNDDKNRTFFKNVLGIDIPAGQGTMNYSLTDVVPNAAGEAGGITSAGANQIVKSAAKSQVGRAEVRETGGVIFNAARDAVQELERNLFSTVRTSLPFGTRYEFSDALRDFAKLWLRNRSEDINSKIDETFRNALSEANRRAEANRFTDENSQAWMRNMAAIVAFTSLLQFMGQDGLFAQISNIQYRGNRDRDLMRNGIPVLSVGAQDTFAAAVLSMILVWLTPQIPEARLNEMLQSIGARQADNAGALLLDLRIALDSNPGSSTSTAAMIVLNKWLREVVKTAGDPTIQAVVRDLPPNAPQQGFAAPLSIIEKALSDYLAEEQRKENERRADAAAGEASRNVNLLLPPNASPAKAWDKMRQEAQFGREKVEIEQPAQAPQAAEMSWQNDPQFDAIRKAAKTEEDFNRLVGQRELVVMDLFNILENKSLLRDALETDPTEIEREAAKVRETAILALAEIGRRLGNKDSGTKSPIISNLIKAIEDRQTDVRLTAIAAALKMVQKLNPSDSARRRDQLIETLFGRLTASSNRAERAEIEAVINALIALNASAEKVIPVLVQTLQNIPDSDIQLRETVVVAMGRFIGNENNPETITNYLSMQFLGDRLSPSIRMLIFEVLDRLDSQGLAETGIDDLIGQYSNLREQYMGQTNRTDVKGYLEGERARVRPQNRQQPLQLLGEIANARVTSPERREKLINVLIGVLAPYAGEVRTLIGKREPPSILLIVVKALARVELDNFLPEKQLELQINLQKALNDLVETFQPDPSPGAKALVSTAQTILKSMEPEEVTAGERDVQESLLAAQIRVKETTPQTPGTRQTETPKQGSQGRAEVRETLNHDQIDKEINALRAGLSTMNDDEAFSAQLKIDRLRNQLNIRTVAIGDAHANPEPIKEILGKAKVTGKNQETVVQVGDFIDRGGKSSETDELLRLTQERMRKAGGDLVRLAGNHELMFLEGMLTGSNERLFDWWMNLKGEEKQKLAAHMSNLKEFLSNDPYYSEMFERIRKDILRGNIKAAVVIQGRIYIHAGITPEMMTQLETEILKSRGIDTEKMDKAEIKKMVSDEEIAEYVNILFRSSIQNKIFRHNIFDNKNGIFWTRKKLDTSRLQAVGHTPGEEVRDEGTQGKAMYLDLDLYKGEQVGYLDVAPNRSAKAVNKGKEDVEVSPANPSEEKAGDAIINGWEESLGKLGRVFSAPALKMAPVGLGRVAGSYVLAGTSENPGLPFEGIIRVDAGAQFYYQISVTKNQQIRFERINRETNEIEEQKDEYWLDTEITVGSNPKKGKLGVTEEIHGTDLSASHFSFRIFRASDGYFRFEIADLKSAKGTEVTWSMPPQFDQAILAGEGLGQEQGQPQSPVQSQPVANAEITKKVGGKNPNATNVDFADQAFEETIQFQIGELNDYKISIVQENGVEKVQLQRFPQDGSQPGTPRIFELGQEVKVGRAPENDYILTDPKVSRNHLTVVINKAPDGSNRFTIINKSSNGTSVTWTPPAPKQAPVEVSQALTERNLGVGDFKLQILIEGDNLKINVRNSQDQLVLQTEETPLLPGQSLRIGRDPDPAKNDLVLSSNKVSGTHGSIVRTANGKWVYIDNGSANGTYDLDTEEKYGKDVGGEVTQRLTIVLAEPAQNVGQNLLDANAQLGRNRPQGQGPQAGSARAEVRAVPEETIRLINKNVEDVRKAGDPARRQQDFQTALNLTRELIESLQRKINRASTENLKDVNDAIDYFDAVIQLDLEVLMPLARQIRNLAIQMKEKNQEWQSKEGKWLLKEGQEFILGQIDDVEWIGEKIKKDLRQGNREFATDQARAVVSDALRQVNDILARYSKGEAAREDLIFAQYLMGHVDTIKNLDHKLSIAIPRQKEELADNLLRALIQEMEKIQIINDREGRSDSMLEILYPVTLNMERLLRGFEFLKGNRVIQDPEMNRKIGNQWVTDLLLTGLVVHNAIATGDLTAKAKMLFNAEDVYGLVDKVDRQADGEPGYYDAAEKFFSFEHYLAEGRKGHVNDLLAQRLFEIGITPEDFYSYRNQVRSGGRSAPELPGERISLTGVLKRLDQLYKNYRNRKNSVPTEEVRNKIDSIVKTERIWSEDKKPFFGQILQPVAAIANPQENKAAGIATLGGPGATVFVLTDVPFEGEIQFEVGSLYSYKVRGEGNNVQVQQFNRGTNEMTSFEFKLGETIKVGRLLGNQIRPDAEGVSRNHLEFSVKKTADGIYQFTIADLKSRNGTKVNWTAPALNQRPAEALQTTRERNLGVGDFKLQILIKGDTLEINARNPGGVVLPTKKVLQAGDILRLGRNANNDLVLSSNKVSGAHGSIVRTANGKWVYIDNGSTNGTYDLDTGEKHGKGKEIVLAEPAQSVGQNLLDAQTGRNRPQPNQGPQGRAEVREQALNGNLSDIESFISLDEINGILGNPDVAQLMSTLNARGQAVFNNDKGTLEGKLNSVLEKLKQAQDALRFVFSEGFETDLNLTLSDLAKAGIIDGENLEMEKDALLWRIRASVVGETAQAVMVASKEILAIMTEIKPETLDKFQSKFNEVVDPIKKTYALTKDKFNLVVTQPEYADLKDFKENLFEPLAPVIDSLVVLSAKDQKLKRSDFSDMSGDATIMFESLKNIRAVDARLTNLGGKPLYLFNSQVQLPGNLKLTSILSQIQSFTDPGLKKAYLRAIALLIIKLSRTDEKERDDIVTHPEKLSTFLEKNGLGYLKNTFQVQNGFIVPIVQGFLNDLKVLQSA